MHILADENFPGLSVQELRRLGHDVLWIRTAMPGVGDADILALAQDEKRLLVTLDKDFEWCRNQNRVYRESVARLIG